MVNAGHIGGTRGSGIPAQLTCYGLVGRIELVKCVRCVCVRLGAA